MFVEKLRHRILEDDDVFLREDVGPTDIQDRHGFPPGESHSDRAVGRPVRSRLSIFDSSHPSSVSLPQARLARAASPSVNRSANSSAIGFTASPITDRERRATL